MRCGGKAARAYKENEMRVISGTARGTRLAALPGEEITRPTVDRVKEGMFSAVQFLLAGARVLDLFAGCALCVYRQQPGGLCGGAAKPKGRRPV